MAFLISIPCAILTTVACGVTMFLLSKSHKIFTLLACFWVFGVVGIMTWLILVGLALDGPAKSNKWALSYGISFTQDFLVG